LQKDKIPNWLQTRLDTGAAKIYPRGTFKITPCVTIAEKLQSIRSLDELYGFANRRKVTGCIDDKIMPKWNEQERRLILARKYELEKLGR
jgi:hypothetical protein